MTEEIIRIRLAKQIAHKLADDASAETLKNLYFLNKFTFYADNYTSEQLAEVLKDL